MKKIECFFSNKQQIYMQAQITIQMEQMNHQAPMETTD